MFADDLDIHSSAEIDLENLTIGEDITGNCCCCSCCCACVACNLSSNRV